jgi:sarcosine oxidase, subunit gamma
MVDQILRRTPPRGAQGSGWSICMPFSAYSLRANLAEAQSSLASPALEPTPDPPFGLSLQPCRALVQGEWAALWLGPDEQLLIGPDADGPALAQRIESAMRSLPHALVDVSHRQCALELRGPLAAAMLNTGCPLDLALDAAPIGFCTRTVFAKAEIVLWRRADSCFQLQTWRSFLPYVTGLLAFAAEEHGH